MALVHESLGDFVLFPRDPSCLEFLDARLDPGFDNFHSASNMHQQLSGHPHTPYDAYSSGSAYSAAAAAYYEPPSSVLDVHKESLGQEHQRWTPAGSPSPSVSQSYDHPPSILSSVSGASGQSTASSAFGSPYSQPTHNLPPQERWSDSHLGLGIAPGIYHTDRFEKDVFPNTHIDNDFILGESKFSNTFVGKPGNLSPSSISVSQSKSFPVSFAKPSSVSSSSSSALPHFPLALNTSVGNSEVTIDTILEEVNSSIGTPKQSASPASALSTKHSPKMFQVVSPAQSQQTGSFKTPTTPASAMFSSTSHNTFSPTAHQYDRNRASVGVPGDVCSQRNPPVPSDRFHPYARPTPPTTFPNQFNKNGSQPPFFSQSSGRYMAPLESSCWFS